jgi:hypothetical protein
MVNWWLIPLAFMLGGCVGFVVVACCVMSGRCERGMNEIKTCEADCDDEIYGKCETLIRAEKAESRLSKLEEAADDVIRCSKGIEITGYIAVRQYDLANLRDALAAEREGKS